MLWTAFGIFHVIRDTKQRSELCADFLILYLLNIYMYLFIVVFRHYYNNGYISAFQVPVRKTSGIIQSRLAPAKYSQNRLAIVGPR